MPKEIKDLKVFMNLMINEPVNTEEKKQKEKQHKPKTVFKKRMTVKKNKKITKFKLRTKRYLYTYKTADSKIVKKILKNLPSGIEKVDIKNRLAARKLKKK